MKVKVKSVGAKKPERVGITGDFIKLDSLLKFASVAGTGGEAKLMIEEGKIFVNGESCTKRGKKCRIGDIVKYEGGGLLIVSAGEKGM